MNYAPIHLIHYLSQFVEQYPSIPELSGSFYNVVYNSFAEKPSTTSPITRSAGQYTMAVRNPLFRNTSATRCCLRPATPTTGADLFAIAVAQTFPQFLRDNNIGKGNSWIIE